MHCHGCGRINRVNAVFCDGCGARLTAPSTTPGSPPTAEAVAIGRGEGHHQPAQDRRPERVREGVFVGRQREMEVLRADLEAALSGRGRLVMLVGEPGIGKTRTAQELGVLAERRGARVLWGHCYENPGAPPYWPWVQVIRTYTRELGAERWQAEMGGGAADIADLVPELRDRMPDLPPSSPLIDPDQARFRLFDSVTTFLSRASKNQALVVVLDNLHWADKSSLLLLEFLARELVQSRILIVGTYRDMEISRQHCIFTRRWERIRITYDPDVIDRYSVGPPRPERSVGRHVHSFESPNRCPEPWKPVSGKAGPVRSDDVCHAVLCRYRCRESPTGYCPATHW